MMICISETVERWRIQRHFERAERLLLANDTSALSSQAQAARQRHIMRLREYREHGVFPRNYTHFNRIPCFNDREDRVCAVGHLLMTSGQAELAHKIAVVDNNAYVKDMAFPELLTWAQDTGLTQDELAAIQPGYEPDSLFKVGVIIASPFVLTSVIFGIISIVRNIQHIRRKRRTRLGFILGMMSTLGAFWCADLFRGLLKEELLNRTLTGDFSTIPTPTYVINTTIVMAVVMGLLGLFFLVMTIWALFPQIRLRRKEVEAT